MLEWKQIDQKVFTWNIGKLPLLESFSFAVDQAVKQVRIHCACDWSPLSNHSTLQNEVFQEYVKFPTVEPRQIETIKHAFFARFQPGKCPYTTIHLFHSEKGLIQTCPACLDGVEWIIPSQNQAGRWVGWCTVPPYWPGILGLKITVDASHVEAPIGLFEGVDFVEMEGGNEASAEKELRWFIGELHEHTNRSTGDLPPDRVIPKYEEADYHFLGLSDHDREPLSKLPKKPNLSLIRGQELESPYGHALLLGTKHHVNWHVDGEIRKLEHMIQETHMQGGLFCVLHPFAVVPGMVKPSWCWESVEWNQVDLLEIWSGIWRDRFPEVLKTLDLWDDLLNRGYRVYGICGKGGWVDREKLDQIPKCVVLSEGNTESALLGALKQGHSYMTLEPAVGMWTESEHGGAFIGDEMRVPAGEPFLLRVTISCIERCFLRIKTNNGILCEMPVASTKGTNLKLIHHAAMEMQWFRLEIFRYGRPLDELIALTNPLFVRGMVSG
ncbi:hypothetical protein GF373_15955 [bacterium]|nr:hypothetical protein [bacterium]